MAVNRVVITGRGAVSPFGLGVPLLLEKIWAGSSAVRHMEEWAEIRGLRSHIAAPVPDFDAKKFLPRSARRTMGAMAVYATLATREAIADADIQQEMLEGGRTGVAIGSTTGSAAAYEEFYLKYLPEKVLDGIKSGEFFKMMGHSCVANVCLALGVEGEQWAPVSACTSSSQAIGLGYILIQAGRQDIVLCGGADEAHASVTGVFDLLRAASFNNSDPEGGCRPFERDRDGVVCGGGSGILVLESLESAERRGRKYMVRLLGLAMLLTAGILPARIKR
ncbi:hypothetical protein DGMP_23780 [Desulfomarina profundi]|uniref:Beta-ketoacyl synthase-like N-terminal domain-containing protein n=1 Tax=Desulfomarina profundi TaxID=2772557 RepID=A0A8D5JPV4_9BACT|nr:beta-ketoacyl synthase N-terminal-like domain-containing protein [Desulfomarina profundi]BCL61685.1 hypothetical protein DGMP_23780 [Desulfomarina profundi]